MVESEEKGKQVAYYSQDFDWKELEKQYADFFQRTFQRAGIRRRKRGKKKGIWKQMMERRKFLQGTKAKTYTKTGKDRNYLTTCWSELELACAKAKAGDELRLLEVGCGVGNAIFPLRSKASLSNLKIVGFDVSETAIALTKKHPLYKEPEVTTFVCNIVSGDPLEERAFLKESFDFCSMIFFLSAIEPTAVAEVLQKVSRLLKKGGLVFFRDYGLYDLAMIRNHKKGNKVSENFYQKSDGTFVYYFSKEKLSGYLADAGFETVSNDYCTIFQENRKTKVNLTRVWINAVFRKL